MHEGIDKYFTKYFQFHKSEMFLKYNKLILEKLSARSN